MLQHLVDYAGSVLMISMKSRLHGTIREISNIVAGAHRILLSAHDHACTQPITRFSGLQLFLESFDRQGCVPCCNHLHNSINREATRRE